MFPCSNWPKKAGQGQDWVSHRLGLQYMFPNVLQHASKIESWLIPFHSTSKKKQVSTSLLCAFPVHFKLNLIFYHNLEFNIPQTCIHITFLSVLVLNSILSASCRKNSLFYPSLLDFRFLIHTIFALNWSDERYIWRALEGRKHVCH